MSAGPHMVYRLYDMAGVLLYVGVTDNWARRRRQHSAQRPWFREVARMESDEFPDRTTALTVEAKMIRSLAPRHNDVLQAPTHADPVYAGPREVTITEAAKMLGVLPDSLRQAVLRNVVKAERAGGIWLITRDEVERYRRERKPNRGRKPRAPRGGAPDDRDAAHD